MVRVPHHPRYRPDPGGTTGTAQTLGPENTDPLVVGSLRIMIGALLITLRARLLNLRTDARWNPLLTGAGILFVVVFQLAFFSAVHQTGVVVATIIAIGTTPVFAGLFARIFLRERLLPMWFLAAALVLVALDASRQSMRGGRRRIQLPRFSLRQ